MDRFRILSQRSLELWPNANPMERRRSGKYCWEQYMAQLFENVGNRSRKTG